MRLATWRKNAADAERCPAEIEELLLRDFQGKLVQTRFVVEVAPETNYTAESDETP